MCAGVVQIFALEVNLRAAHFAAGARRMVDGRGTANEVLEFVLELGQKLRVVLVAGVGLAQFLDGVGQGFADEAAAIRAEMAGSIRLLIGIHGGSLQVVHRPHARRQRSVGSSRRP